ncbi:MAG TPA: LytTR family DNA-binding domain-containing protein [Chryseolinea sp.]|nr:LytTR family DNA-binding domain-containing protein [Chryseolinea sp.]
MQVAIVEDEILTARRLSEMLVQYDSSIEVIRVLSSVEGFVQWFSQEDKPDLIFMDIKLEDDSAFRIFEQVKVAVPVVFTTAYDEYMLQAFQSNGIDYLLKPVDQQRLSAAVDKFKSLRTHFTSEQQAALADLVRQPAGYKERFLVTVGTRTISYTAGEVAYFFVNDKITYLVAKQGNTSPLNYSLEWLEQHIDPKMFFRVNRQCIVSYDAILQGQNQSNSRIKLEVKPAPRFDVFVSGDRVTDFRRWFGK